LSVVAANGAAYWQTKHATHISTNSPTEWITLDSTQRATIHPADSYSERSANRKTKQQTLCAAHCAT
jgi:hypothetical protein